MAYQQHPFLARFVNRLLVAHGLLHRLHLQNVFLNWPDNRDVLEG